MAATILIIDDDNFTRQILCKILRRDKSTASLELEILQAANGVEGLKLFREHKPNLVIVDLFMPKVDGFQVCKEIREVDQDNEVVIAVTSGVYKDSSITGQLEEDYKAQFFAKPYQLKNIAEFVSQALSPSGVLDSSRAIPTSGEDLQSGDLDPEGAAKLFWDLLEREATGRLILRRGQIVRQIEFFVGHPISVTTNVREETLGHFLVSRKIIDSVSHRKALALAASKKVRLGEAMIGMGIMSAQELIAHLTAQNRMKLVNALRWKDGSWTFRTGKPRKGQSNALNFAEVIVNGLAATSEIEPPPPALTRLKTMSLRLNARGERLLPQIGTSISSSFVQCFRSPTTMEALREAGVSRTQVYQSLDVLQCCGGLESAPGHPPSQGVPTPIASEASEPLDLSALASTGQASATEDDLYSSLFDQASQSTRAGGARALTVADVAQGQRTDQEGGAPNEPALDLGVPSDAPIELDTPADQNFDEESVVNVTFSSIASDESLLAARKVILEEFLRIQDKTLYEVLNVPADAPEAAIQQAYSDLKSKFDKAQFASLDLGPDFQKLSFVQASYEDAMETLFNDERRQLYDDSLHSVTGDMPDAPSMDAELHCRQAEELILGKNFAKAIECLNQAVGIAPRESAYRAHLGWALFENGERSEVAADEARHQLNIALGLDAQSMEAHEYKGLIHAHLGDDPDAAEQHLGKALDANPRRAEALRAMESLHLGKGQFRSLERLYRRLLFKLNAIQGPEESVIWSRLGDLYQHYMHDSASAMIAFEAALRLVPNDAGLRAKHAELQSGDEAQFFARNKSLIQEWQQNPANAQPLLELFSLARASDDNDASFLAASGLVAAGQAEEASTEFYQRYRPHFVVRAQQVVDPPRWAQLLHPNDYSLVGALYSLLAPIIGEVAPLLSAKEEVDQADQIKDSMLSTDVRSIRRYLAHTLQVPEPAIYSRADYGNLIHVASLDKPVLLAGYEALTSSNKLELAFRMGRAMSYLKPGRAVAAGSPARVLKSAMLACYALGAPEAVIPDPEGTVALFKSALQDRDTTFRYQAQELVAHISQEHPTLNLSHWSRSLARTADRAGLLLCGDLPISLRCATDAGGSSASVHLLAFCVSASHLQLRRSMGLSIDI